MNELPVSVISQRLREGDRAASCIPELFRNRGWFRGEHELREWHRLVDLILSGAVSPRKVVMWVEDLYDPDKGDLSPVLRSPGILECELRGGPTSVAETLRHEKKLSGDKILDNPKWTTRLALALANSSAQKLVLSNFMSPEMFAAFSKALQFNRTIQHLEIDLARLTKMITMSSMLRGNTTLHTLICHEWPVSLLEPLTLCLPQSTTLRHLRLMRCSHRGLPSCAWMSKQVAFFKALGRNRGLRSFAMLLKLVDDNIFQVLAHALAAHTTLVDVELDPFVACNILERGLLANNNIVGLTIGHEFYGINYIGHPYHQMVTRLVRDKPMRRLELLGPCCPVDFSLHGRLAMNSIVELKIVVAPSDPMLLAVAEILTSSASLRNLNICFLRTCNFATFAEALAVNQGLRRLVLRYGGERMLRFKGLCPHAAIHLLRAVAKHPSLEELDVKRMDCTVQLAEMVKTHPSLTSIHCCLASVEQVEALISAAKANPRLLSVKGPVSREYICKQIRPYLHILYSYLEMNRHGRHKLLIEHPYLLADLMGSFIDFRTRINLMMENPVPLIHAIQGRLIPFSTYMVEHDCKV